MKSILRKMLADLYVGFASSRNTTVAWFLIIVLAGALVIESLDRLP